MPWRALTWCSHSLVPLIPVGKGIVRETAGLSIAQWGCPAPNHPLPCSCWCSAAFPGVPDLSSLWVWRATSATFIVCLVNRLTSHLCWHLWKMTLILSVYCFSDSFFMCIYSADMSGGIRFMLNLYVNFNIEAILYLKNKINSSVSFLTWYCILSLLENKIISECILSKLQF